MFEETQSFREKWLGAYLSFIAIAVFISFVFPNSWLESSIALAIIFGAVSLLYFAELCTRVEYDGIHIKFFPFHLSERVIKWDNVEHFEAEKYKPLLEFGGWGVRWRPKKIAYNVRGNEGVRITKTDGKQVLIGSKKAEELEDAIDEAKNEWH